MKTMLHTIVLALLSLQLVNCDGSGSGGSEFLQLRLASDAPCYGIRIDVDGPIGPAGVYCEAEVDLTPLGCTATYDSGPNGVSFLVSGCFVPAGTPLFLCNVNTAQKTQFLVTAETRCGCGCATDCPDNPDLLYCNEDASQCQSVDRNFVDDGDAVVAGAQETATTGLGVTSSTDECGGLHCDAGGEGSVSMTTGTRIKELEFDVELGLDGGCVCDIDSCTFSNALSGPVRQTYLAPNVVHICIAEPQGLDAVRYLLTCDYFSGGSTFHVKNVRALGADLKVVSPPSLVVDSD